MKKLLALGILSATLILGGTALAYSPAYRAVYCYPTGSYWVKQLTKFPDYYSQPAVNAYWTARMGAATQYCI